MKIGIDGRILSTQRGMGRVLRSLLGPLLDLGASEQFYLYVGPRTEALPKRQNLRVQTIGSGLTPAYEQIHLPRAVRKDAPDVLWCPANTGPIRPPAPTVLTLHDVIFRHRGSLLPHSSSAYQRFGRVYTDWSASRLARSAVHVVTDSQFSAHEIKELLGVSPARLSVIPLGVTIDAPGEVLSVPKLRALGIEHPYFLCLGAIDPRKNTELTIDAFLDSCVACKAQLVVPGFKSAESEPYRARISRHAHANSVVFLDFVSDDTLASLYRSCVAFVFASLFEGFGLPVLEAMHFGAPVLASNQTSIPEIGGDAILYFDPHSKAALSEGIERLLGDPDLRKRLGEAGRRRSQQFSWQTSAEMLYRTLRGVAK